MSNVRAEFRDFLIQQAGTLYSSQPNTPTASATTSALYTDLAGRLRMLGTDGYQRDLDPPRVATGQSEDADPLVIASLAVPEDGIYLFSADLYAGVDGSTDLADAAFFSFGGAFSVSGGLCDFSTIGRESFGCLKPGHVSEWGSVSDQTSPSAVLTLDQESGSMTFSVLGKDATIVNWRLVFQVVPLT